MFIHDSLLPVADSHLEIDVIADPKHAGWSPGSTSLAGYAREITFWRRDKYNVDPYKKSWSRVGFQGPVSKDFILSCWEEMKDGFKEDWTEKDSHDLIRELIGPSE